MSLVPVIREVSQALFAAPYRLEIMLVVARATDDTFSAGETYEMSLAGLDGASEPDKATVSRTLASLRAVGLLTQEKRGGPYRRVDSVFWGLIRDYGAELERRYAPRPLGLAAGEPQS